MSLYLVISHIFLFCFAFQASAQFQNDSLGNNSVCSNLVEKDLLKNKSEKKRSHRMVIFIHGTILPAPSLNGLKKVAAQAFKDGIKSPKNLYQSYLDGRRHKKGFYGYQPLGEKGLTKIEDVYSDECSYTEASKLLSDIFIHTNSLDDTIQESCSCYVFGWDGRLEYANRVEWAKRLHSALSNEVKKVRQDYDADQIEVDIFAHSHGGNVALSMVPVQQELSEELSINRLVMLGTPIQIETEKYVLDSMFKKVYLIYSQGDRVQVSDVFSTRGSSKRRFEGEAEKNKVVHIEVKIDKKDPSHSELWSYGMVGQILYRKNLSIYPLPVVAFVPEIFKIFHRQLVPGATVKIDINRGICDWLKVCAHDAIILRLYDHNLNTRSTYNKFKNYDFALRGQIPISDFPESNKAFLGRPPQRV